MAPQVLSNPLPHLLYRRCLPKHPWKLSLEVHVALLGPEAVNAPALDGESKLSLVGLMPASSFRRRARFGSILANLFILSLAVIQSIVVAFLYSKTTFEPEPEHVCSCLRVLKGSAVA